MLKKTIVIVVVFILLALVSTLPAMGASSDKINEHIKLFKKVIEQNPDIAKITNRFGSPEHLVKR